MKKILFLLVLLLGLGTSKAQVQCSEDPFCRPTYYKGRFNAYGQDYVLSIPRQFSSGMMSFTGENEWIKIKRNDPDRHKVDPSKFYFNNADLNYRWDNLEPWDGKNDTWRAKEVHLATKIVYMRVRSRGGKSIPMMTTEEYDKALNEERKFQHNSLSKKIHNLTHDIDWDNKNNKIMIELLQKIGLKKVQTNYELTKDSYKNILTSEQLKEIGVFQEENKLYYFSYTHTNRWGRHERKTDYYWYIYQQLNIVTDVIKCTFNTTESYPPRCELETALPDKKLLIKISFSGWHLKEWQQIKANSLQLLESLITQVEEK